MIYFTKPKETGATVAHRFSHLYSDTDELSQEIVRVNANTLTARGPKPFYAPHRPLWVPIISGYPENWRKQILFNIDHVPPSQLFTLAQAQRDGVNIHHIVRAYQLVRQMNEQSEDETIGLTGGAFSARFADRVVDLKKDRLSEFEEVLEEMKGRLKDFAHATDKETKRLARIAYKKTFLKLNEKFNYELNEYRLTANRYYRKYWKGLDWTRVKHEGYDILDTREAREVVKAANYLTRLSKRLFVIDVITGGCEVVKAYREGKDWFKEAVNVGIDIGAGAFVPELIGSGLALLSLTPVGWIAIIVVGSLEAATAITGASIFQHYIDPHI